VPGRGWSSPSVAQGRVWLTTAVVSGRAASLRLIGFDAADGRVAVNTEAFKVYLGRVHDQRQVTATRRQRPLVVGDRVYVHFGANGTAAVSTAAPCCGRRSCGTSRSTATAVAGCCIADLLIVNCDGFRPGVRRRARPHDAQGAMATVTPVSVQPRVFDAAHDSGWRTGSAVSVGAYVTTAYGTTHGPRDLARQLSRRFSNVPRPVYGHVLVFINDGISAAVPAGCSPRRHGRT
jgi:hypothetical protein